VRARIRGVKIRENGVEAREKRIVTRKADRN